jgi:hypothetical protein
MRNWVVLFVLVIAFSCSTTSKLRKFEGKPIQSVMDAMGKPARIGAFSSDSLFIYENKEVLRGAEISKGQTTLDPMITPAVTKSEIMIFRVKGGIVTEVRKEIEYTRR